MFDSRSYLPIVRNLCSLVRSARLAINPVQSARISTAGRFHIKYGRVEVEAKLPVGDWLWPAIWLLPEVRTATYLFVISDLSRNVLELGSEVTSQDVLNPKRYFVARHQPKNKTTIINT